MKSPDKTLKTFLLILFFLSCFFISKDGIAANLKYYISIDDPSSHKIRVKTLVNNIDEDILWVARPVAWLPALPNVSNISVTDGEHNSLNFTKYPPRQYGADDNEKISIIRNGKQTVLIEYYVDLTVNTTSPHWKLDTDYGLVESQIILYQPSNIKVQMIELEFSLPQNWKVVSRLNKISNNYMANPNDFVVFGWEKIKYHIWGPIGFGNFSVYEREIKDIRLEVALYGNELIKERVADDFFKLFECSQDWFPTIKNANSFSYDYIYIPSFNSPPYDISSRDHIPGDFRTLSEDQTQHRYYISRYREVAHTLFHTTFSHLDFNLLRTMCFGGLVEEGPIQYFAFKSLEKTKVWTTNKIYQELKGYYDDYCKFILNTEYDVPIYPDFVWQQFPNNPLNSYDTRGIRNIIAYEKTAYILWYLDYTIMKLTKNQKSLVDVFQYLHQNVVSNDADRLSIYSDLLNACNIVTGQDFTAFFNSYIAGNSTLPPPNIFYKISMPWLLLLLVD